MGPDLHRDLPAAPVVLRCPSCAGALRPDAPWCGQCYADLRSGAAPPASPAAPPASSATGPPSVSPAAPAHGAAQAVVPDGAATWPCTACDTRNPLDAAVCAACGTGFLATLRAAGEPLLVLPVVGDLTALTRAARLGLAAAVVLLVVLLTALGGVLLS